LKIQDKDTFKKYLKIQDKILSYILKIQDTILKIVSCTTLLFWVWSLKLLTFLLVQDMGVSKVGRDHCGRDCVCK